MAMKRACGHLAAIRGMAMELNQWAEEHGRFIYRKQRFNRAKVEEGELFVTYMYSQPWLAVDLANARFTDRDDNDLMAIK